MYLSECIRMIEENPRMVFTWNDGRMVARIYVRRGLLGIEVLDGDKVLEGPFIPFLDDGWMPVYETMSFEEACFSNGKIRPVREGKPEEFKDLSSWISDLGKEPMKEFVREYLTGPWQVEGEYYQNSI